MKIVKGLMSVAAVAMIATQPVAASGVAQKLSLKNLSSSDVRVASRAGKQKAAIAGVPVAFAILGAVGLIVLVVVLADNSDSN